MRQVDGGGGGIPQWHRWGKGLMWEITKPQWHRQEKGWWRMGELDHNDTGWERGWWAVGEVDHCATGWEIVDGAWGDRPQRHRRGWWGVGVTDHSTTGRERGSWGWTEYNATGRKRVEWATGMMKGTEAGDFYYYGHQCIAMLTGIWVRFVRVTYFDADFLSASTDRVRDRARWRVGVGGGGSLPNARRWGEGVGGTYLNYQIA